MIGDVDPEDAWDDGDALLEKLDILERVIIALRASRTEHRHDARRGDALRLIAKLPPSDRLDSIRKALVSS